MPKRCVECGKYAANISQKGLCAECAERRMVNTIRQLREKEGEIYSKWKANILKSVKGDKNDDS